MGVVLLFHEYPFLTFCFKNLFKEKSFSKNVNYNVQVLKTCGLSSILHLYISE